MPLDPANVAAASDALDAAERNRAAIAPLTEQFPGLDLDGAYAIQRDWIMRRLGRGGRLFGWKVGLTSLAMQRLLGVDEPDFGQLLDNTQLSDGSTLASSELVWPRVEPEIAFRLRSALKGPGVTAADILDATAELLPSLEIVDSRVRDWKIKLADTVADNASCGRFVIGSKGTAPGEFDLRLTGMNFYVDDELVSSATGAAVLGNPAGAVAWLVNTLSTFGEALQAGQIVMPGALVAAVDATPGMTFRADFDRLGSVSINAA